MRNALLDRRILLARHFSIRVTDGFGKERHDLKSVFLIDLGFHENTRGDILAYGEESTKDSLVTKSVSFMERFVLNPETLH